MAKCETCDGCGKLVKTGDDEQMSLSEFRKQPYEVVWFIALVNKPYDCPDCKGTGEQEASDGKEA